jgi:hypothetical protein
MDQLGDGRSQAIEIIEPDSSIDVIVADLDCRYRELKDRVEEESLLRQADWWAVGEEEKKARRAAMMPRLPVNREDDAYLPHADSFRQDIVPVIEQSVDGDTAEFRRVGETCYKIIETMAARHPCQGATMRFMIEKVLNQYFNFLYSEKDNVVMAVAAMQAQRANLEAEKEQGPDMTGQDYPFDDRTIRTFLDMFRETHLEAKIGEFAGLCAGIRNGHVMEDYLRNLPRIIEALEQETPEITERYIRLAKAQEFPSPHASFDFKDPEAVQELKLFDQLGQYAEQTIELFEAALEKEVAHSTFDDSAAKYVEEVLKIANSGRASDLHRNLEEAIHLTRLGLPGMHYLEYAEEADKNTRGDTQNFLRYATDLAHVSKRCAVSYMLRLGKEFKLPARQLEKYHNAGLKLAREFGESAADYFDTAIRVLKLMPERFDSWLEKLTNFGRERPQLFGKVTGYFSLTALQAGSLDEMLETTAFFDDGVKERNKRMSARCIDINRDANFANDHYSARKAGISAWRYAEVTLKYLDYMSDHDTTHLLVAAANGADFDKAVALLPALLDNQIMSMMSGMEPVIDIINADISIAQKERMLAEYSLVLRDAQRNDAPHLDLEGRWREGLREKLVAETSQYLGMDTSGLEMPDLVLLAKTKQAALYRETSPSRRLQYLVQNKINGEQTPKTFPAGKTYGALRTETKAFSRFDGLELRMQKGELQDIADGDRLKSHSFYPHGQNKTVALNYVLHESVGLLQLIPTADGEESAPIGVAVCLDTEDSDGERYIVVDHTELPPIIRDFETREWAEMVYQGVMRLAEDIGAKKVLYNTDAQRSMGDPEEDFMNYIQAQHPAERTEVRLKLRDAESPTLIRFAQPHMEELQRAQAEEAQDDDDGFGMFRQDERVRELKKSLSSKLGIITRSWSRLDADFFGQNDLPGNIGGMTTGIVYSLDRCLPDK